MYAVIMEQIKTFLLEHLHRIETIKLNELNL